MRVFDSSFYLLLPIINLPVIVNYAEDKNCDVMQTISHKSWYNISKPCIISMHDLYFIF